MSFNKNSNAETEQNETLNQSNKSQIFDSTFSVFFRKDDVSNSKKNMHNT